MSNLSWMFQFLKIGKAFATCFCPPSSLFLINQGFGKILLQLFQNTIKHHTLPLVPDITWVMQGKRLRSLHEYHGLFNVADICKSLGAAKGDRDKGWVRIQDYLDQHERDK